MQWQSTLHGCHGIQPCMQWLHWQGMQWHSTLHSFVATKLALVLSACCANTIDSFMVVNTLECHLIIIIIIIIKTLSSS